MYKKLLHTDYLRHNLKTYVRNVYNLCMKFHIPNSSGSFVIAIKPKWKKLLLHLGSKFGEYHLWELSQ